MVFQNDFCRAVERRAHRGQLHQHLRTVAPILHHALDGLQVPDRAGEAVEDRLGLGVRVAVRVVMLLPVLVDVGVHDSVAVVVIIYFFVFDMHVCASGTVLFNKIYRNSRRLTSPPGGWGAIRNEEFGIKYKRRPRHGEWRGLRPLPFGSGRACACRGRTRGSRAAAQSAASCARPGRKAAASPLPPPGS